MQAIAVAAASTYIMLLIVCHGTIFQYWYHRRALFFKWTVHLRLTKCCINNENLPFMFQQYVGGPTQLRYVQETQDFIRSTIAKKNKNHEGLKVMLLLLRQLSVRTQKKFS